MRSDRREVEVRSRLIFQVLGKLIETKQSTLEAWMDNLT